MDGGRDMRVAATSASLGRHAHRGLAQVERGVVAFGLGLALLVGNAVVAVTMSGRLLNDARGVTEAVGLRAAVDRAHATTAAAETAQRGYLMMGTEEFATEYREARYAMDGAARTLQALAERVHEHDVRAPELLEERARELDEAVRLFDTGAPHAAVLAAAHGTDTRESLAAVVSALGAEADAMVRLRQERLDGTARASALTFSVAEAAALILLCVAVVLWRTEAETRRRAAADVGAARERLRAVLASAPIVVFGLDREGRFTVCEGASVAQVDLSAAAVLGRPVSEVFPNAPGFLADVRRALHAEVFASTLEYRGRTFDVHFAPVLDHDVVLGVTGVATETTERVHAERALRRLTADLERRVTERTAELEATNRELESFCYTVSHDLRAPLRSIDGFSAALDEDCGPQIDAVGHTYVARIRAATRRMGQLIDDLLELSRVSRAELAREAVDVSWLCLQILEDLRRTDPPRAVIVEVAPDLVAHADPRLLRVVLENLLGNAWKFSSRRDPAHIGVHGTKDGVRTTYTISDDGAGFDMAYAHRLFNAFQRLHSPTEFEGTGIGLATVYRIVTRHGGRVWADSAPDRGARFSFTLE